SESEGRSRTPEKSGSLLPLDLLPDLRRIDRVKKQSSYSFPVRGEARPDSRLSGQASEEVFANYIQIGPTRVPMLQSDVRSAIDFSWGKGRCTPDELLCGY